MLLRHNDKIIPQDTQPSIQWHIQINRITYLSQNTMAEGNITRLLKDMEHGDQDNREMAATDMCTEILKGVKLDPGLEKSICHAYIKQLEDCSVNVRGNAVKCISKICSKISESQFGMIANKLTECVVKGAEEFRDIYSTCLKTLISEADESFGKTMCSALLEPLIEGTGHKTDAVKEQCIELTNDLLKRFNVVLVHNPGLMNRDLLMNNLITQLHSSNASLRKRACTCFGSLAVTLTPKQLSGLIALLLKNIKPENKTMSYPFIETLGAVSGTVGYKLAPNLEAIMDTLRPFCAIKDPADPTPAEIDHSIKEVCLTVYDFSVRKCPKEASEHLDEMVETALNLLGYDPNYNPDVVMAESAEEDLGAWGEPEEEQHAVEDDSSWKVRKASAKLLATIVKYRNDKVKPMYDRVITMLVSRLEEREESIKCEILSIFTDMVKGIVVGDTNAIEKADMPMLLSRKSSAEVLLKDLPGALMKIQEHFSDKSLAVRETIVILLYNMALAVPEFMNGVLLGSVLPKMLSVFKDSSATVKIILLQTLRRLIRTSLTEDMYLPYVKQIIEVLHASTKEEYYKLPAEAMRTAGSLVRLLRRQPEVPNPEATAAIKEIYTMCAGIFKLADIDPEIKQGVIHAMESIVAFASDILTEKEVDDILVTLQERLKNEALRHHVMKAYHTILASPTKLSIEGRLETLLGDFLQMAHKVARPVKLAALDTLLGMCTKYPAVCKKSASAIVKDITPLLKEGDLHILQRSAKIMCHLIPDASDEALMNLLEAMLVLCKTTLVNSVLDDAIAIMQGIASREKGAMNPEAISEALSKECAEKNIRPVAAIIARVVMLKEGEIPKMLEVYMKVLKSKENPLKRKLTYMIIANIGLKKDLSKFTDLNALIEDQLKNAEEEMKMNVAICLGNIALGNKGHYIPQIMDKLKSPSQLSYLMLIALREIVALDHEGVLQSVTELLPVLKAQADTDDDGYRTMIAEILGKLLYADPYTLAPELEKNLTDKVPNIRATYALSYKYWYGRGKHDLAMFHASLPKLIELYKDTDVKVQKALLDSLTHVAHLNALHLRAYSIQIFAATIPLTKYRPELVKTVDLGPLQHKIDEGEPVRKGAYILLDNMLTELNDKMDLPLLADKVVDGLSDESDEVQSSCQQILIKLCEISPGTILGPLEKLLEQIAKAVKKLQDKIHKKQDVDRSSDNLRGFLRVLLAMNRLPEIDLNEKFQEYRKNLLSDKTVAAIYEELSKIVEQLNYLQICSRLSANNDRHSTYHFMHTDKTKNSDVTKRNSQSVINTISCAQQYEAQGAGGGTQAG
eukprot:TRINITY_DN282_c0_g2_i1.p1 TRINITY_DN282_c0_g2~~TRINITY_DN282_c0_g2_i1.p1  ORF type:complete len:1310 (+),score=174.23 TRINITY_DN282_c0_g2_i1:9683-13612(+)